MKKVNVTAEAESKILEAFELLRNSNVNPFDSFKITFILFAYKRFNDANIIKIPDDCKWDQLVSCSAEQLFDQLDTNIIKIERLNELQPISESLKISKNNRPLSISTIRSLFDLFNALDLSEAQYSVGNINLITNNLFQKYTHTKSVYQHENMSLNRLAIALLDPGENESIYFPECGFGDIIIEAFEHFENNKIFYLDDENEPYFKASGSISNKEIWALVVLRILLAEINWVPIFDKYYFADFNTNEFGIAKHNEFLTQEEATTENGEASKTHEDVINEIKNIRERTFYKYDSLEDVITVILSLADVIFLVSPFGSHLANNVSTKFTFNGHSFEIPQRNPELFFLFQALKHLFKKGRIGIVLPAKSLFEESSVNKQVREFLINEDLLEAIVQLPSDIFPHTNLKLVLMIINAEKSKEKKRKFAFITVKATQKDGVTVITNSSINKAIHVYKNFNSLSNDYIATLEEIQQRDYNLLPSFYIGALADEIKKIRKSKTGRQLEDIGRIIRGASIEVSNKLKGIPVISTKNLSKDIKDLYLNLDDISYADSVFSTKAVKQKCIIVSLVGSELKPTVFDPEEKEAGCPEILLGKNVAAIFPDDNIVDFEYLYYQLNSSLVKTQFEENLATAGIPNISLPRLKKNNCPCCR